MRRSFQNIDPLDLQVNKKVGIDLNFNAPGVFRGNYQTSEALKNNIINFLLTGRQERYFNTGFGSGIRDLLFENLSVRQISVLEEELAERIQNYFPKVKIKELRVVPEPDRNRVEFEVSYTVPNTDIEDDILIEVVQ